MSFPTENQVTAIYVVGPSSTGKTTLCNALADLLGIDKQGAYVTEVARTVMKQTGFNRETVRMVEMQIAIMEAQLKREEEAMEVVAMREPGVPRVMLSDRSAVDPIVYGILNAGSNPAELMRRRHILVENASFQAVLPHYRRSTFVLLRPVAQWQVDDGIRSMDDHDGYFEVFVELMGELGIPFTVIGESMLDLEERVTTVMRLAGLD